MGGGGGGFGMVRGVGVGSPSACGALIWARTSARTHMCTLPQPKTTSRATGVDPGVKPASHVLPHECAPCLGLADMEAVGHGYSIGTARTGFAWRSPGSISRIQIQCHSKLYDRIQESEDLKTCREVCITRRKQ